MTDVQLCKKVCQFLPISTVHCHFAVKRFGGDSRAKSALPSHKKPPAQNSTTSLSAALPFDFTRSVRLSSRSKEQRQYEAIQFIVEDFADAVCKILPRTTFENTPA